MKQTIAQTQVKFNQIPSDSKLLTHIPKLPRDGSVQYRIYGAFDPARPNKFFGRTLIMPSEDTVMDPDTNEVYDIAFIKGVGAGAVPEIGEIIFNDFHAATVTLFGNSAEDQRKYQYIELCNFLADNPYRDISKPILIERVDDAKDLDHKRTKRKKIHAALNTIEAMDNEEVLSFIRANNMADPGSVEKRKALLEDLAENQPDKFMRMSVIDYKSLFPIIDDAVAKKVISWDKINRTWLSSDKDVILKVNKGFGVSQKDELAKFLASSKKSLDIIKSELTEV